MAASSGVVYFPCGTYNFTTLTVSKRLILQGAGDCTQLSHTLTTGTALTFDYPGTLYTGSGLKNLVLAGPSSGFNNSTIGLFLGGGTYGALGFEADSVKIQNFGTGVKYGDQTWVTQFNHSMIVNNGVNLYFDTNTLNSGENIVFNDTTFAITSLYPNGFETNCVQIIGGASPVFKGGSFDGCQVKVNGAAYSASFIGNHFEAPGGPMTDPFMVVTGATVMLKSPDFAIGGLAGATSLIQATGGNVNVDGAAIYSYATSSLASFIALSGTANAYESGTYVTTNNVTQLVTNSGAGTYSSINRSNTTFPGALNIGATSSVARLSVQDGNITALFGADVNATTLTNLTRKYTRVAFPNYNLAALPVATFVGDSDGTNNILHIGGGSALLDAATSLRFYTGSTNITPTGTERMRIDSSGNIGIGTTSPSTIIHAYGSVPVLTLDSSGATENSAIFFQQQGALRAAVLYRNGAGLALFESGVDRLNIVNGKVGIGTSTPQSGPLVMASGAYVSTGGTWTNASSRELKTNFTALDKNEILHKISQLDISQWNYKSEDSSTTHIGPIAEDFYSLFGLGGTNSSISTIDPAGVALVGIQALNLEINGTSTELVVGESLFSRILSSFEFLGVKIEQGIAYFKDIFANRVTTKELCVGDASSSVCLTKDQLQKLLEGANAGPVGDIGVPPTPSSNETSSSTSETATTTLELNPAMDPQPTTELPVENTPPAPEPVI